MSILLSCTRLSIAVPRGLHVRLLSGWQSNGRLPNAPGIHVFKIPKDQPQSSKDGSYLLTLLDSNPPSPELAVGVAESIPPTPRGFTPNKRFLSVLHTVFQRHAADDPSAQAEAIKLVAGSMGVGTAAPSAARQRRRRGENDGAFRGGWIHIADERKVPDWARVPDVDDIIASVRVGRSGAIERGPDGYQPNEMYRVVSPDGVLGISQFLREKLVEELKRIEMEKVKNSQVGR